jgi:DNA-binding CsgD family transcriptional regulator
MNTLRPIDKAHIAFMEHRHQMTTHQIATKLKLDPRSVAAYMRTDKFKQRKSRRDQHSTVVTPRTDDKVKLAFGFAQFACHWSAQLMGMTDVEFIVELLKSTGTNSTSAGER